MKIYETKDYQEMSRQAANILSAQVILKPDCVLGLATGSTPIGTYDQLVDWYNKGDVDFSQVRTVNLDEYRGLTRDNDQSYYYFMHKHLFDRVNIKLENTNVPDGTQEDAEKETKEQIAYYMNNAKVIREGLVGAGYEVYGGIDAPYIWLKTPDNMKSWDFFDYLLEELNIVGTPGSGFGPSGEGYFRLTAFGSAENTVKAMKRIKAGKAE